MGNDQFFYQPAGDGFCYYLYGFTVEYDCSFQETANRNNFHFSSLGRTATASRPDHIRDLIEQVLFTSPGERVMRPDFGSGLLALVFEPNDSALAATTQVLVQGALQQYLSHLIVVQAVDVRNDDSTLHVDVNYVVLSDRTAHDASFAIPVPSGGVL